MDPTLELLLELVLLIKSFISLIIRLAVWILVIAAANIYDLLSLICYLLAVAVGIILYAFFMLLSYISFWFCVAAYPTYQKLYDIKLQQYDNLLNSPLLGKLHVGVCPETQQIVAMLYISPDEVFFWEWYAEIKDHREEERPRKASAKVSPGEEVKPHRRYRKQTVKPADRRLTDEERKLFFER